MKTATREQWLNTAAAIIIDEIIEPNINKPAPKMRYSLTAPKASSTSKVLGECWNKTASSDETFEIFLTANLGNTDSLLILSTLVHEQLHAYDGNKNGHKAPFQHLCKLVGLEGGRTNKAAHSFTATKASPELQAQLTDIIQTIGDIPHAKMAANLSGKKKQTNRQKLVECKSCGFKFRASQSAIDSMIYTECLACEDGQLEQEQK